MMPLSSENVYINFIFFIFFIFHTKKDAEYVYLATLLGLFAILLATTAGSHNYYYYFFLFNIGEGKMRDYNENKYR
jgi:hypothetical protein